jgi:hypothetical protein
MYELNRLRAEYLDMPALRLTREQVERLCGLERTVCERVLATLVDTRFLCVNADGTYARLAESAAVPRPHLAKPTMGGDTRSLKAS